MQRIRARAVAARRWGRPSRRAVARRRGGAVRGAMACAPANTSASTTPRVTQQSARRPAGPAEQHPARLTPRRTRATQQPRRRPTPPPRQRRAAAPLLRASAGASAAVLARRSRSRSPGARGRRCCLLRATAGPAGPATIVPRTDETTPHDPADPHRALRGATAPRRGHPSSTLHRAPAHTATSPARLGQHRGPAAAPSTSRCARVEEYTRSPRALTSWGPASWKYHPLRCVREQFPRFLPTPPSP